MALAWFSAVAGHDAVLAALLFFIYLFYLFLLVCVSVWRNGKEAFNSFFDEAPFLFILFIYLFIYLFFFSCFWHE